MYSDIVILLRHVHLNSFSNMQAKLQNLNRNVFINGHLPKGTHVGVENFKAAKMLILAKGVKA